jgi:hypothetical protein
MKTYSVELTELEELAFQYAAINTQEWVENSVKHRCQIALDEIIGVVATKYLTEGIQMPTTQLEVVQDAYQRGWIQTASDKLNNTLPQ